MARHKDKDVEPDITAEDLLAATEDRELDTEDDAEELETVEPDESAPVGDINIADLEEVNVDGEFYPPLTVEDTVTLGENEFVPAHLQGRRAFITDAPRETYKPGDESDLWITVKTRDEYNATLYVPLSACTLLRGGRVATVRG